jgi:hypothetical protein
MEAKREKNIEEERRKIKDERGGRDGERVDTHVGFCARARLSVLPGKKEENKEALINSYPP